MIRISKEFGWNNPDSSYEYAFQALKLSKKKKLKRYQTISLIEMSMASFISGNYARGIEDAQHSLRMAKTLNEPNILARSHNALGLLYQQVQKFQPSINEFHECLVIYHDTKNISGQATAYNNMANSYFKMGDLPKSIQIRKKAISFRKELNEISGLADCYNDIGETYIQLQEIDSAIIYLKQCLEIKQEIGDDEMVSLSALNLGMAYIRKNDFTNAKKFLALSNHYALKIGAGPYRLEILKQLAKIAHAESDFKNEADLLNRIINLKDTLLKEEDKRQVNRLHLEFETEKKAIQFQALRDKHEQDKKLNEAEQRQKNVILVFSGLGVLFLLIFLLVVYNRFQLTKKQKAEIEIQKHLVEEKQKEILDSIKYARRIQRAIITSENYLQKQLGRLHKKNEG